MQCTENMKCTHYQQTKFPLQNEITSIKTSIALSLRSLFWSKLQQNPMQESIAGAYKTLNNAGMRTKSPYFCLKKKECGHYWCRKLGRSTVRLSATIGDNRHHASFVILHRFPLPYFRSISFSY